MTVAVVYVHPRINHRLYIAAAKKFVASYQAHPPGATPHDVVVVVNGDQPNKSDERTFSPLPVKFLSHDNGGKDIGAFQLAARSLPHDLLVFVGSNVHFRVGGWLDIMVRSFEKFGPGVYGPYAFHQPDIHIRTTCFWIPRELFLLYPHYIHNESRYEFEHGRSSITRWCIENGFNAWMVTMRGAFPPQHWTHVENQDALILDQHSDRIGYK